MLTLKKGEVREVGFEFLSKDVFIIGSATYEVKDRNGEVVDSGVATIDSKKVLALFNATNSGSYYVNFTVKIGDEIYSPQKYIGVNG
jgi:hypothetical protein